MDFSINTITSNFNTSITISVVDIVITPSSSLVKVTWKFPNENPIVGSTKITKTFTTVGTINYSVIIEDSLGGIKEKSYSLTILSNNNYDMISSTSPVHNIMLPDIITDSVAILSNKVRWGFQKLDKILDIFINSNDKTSINPTLLKNPTSGRWLGGLNKYIEDITIPSSSSVVISSSAYGCLIEELDLKLLILDEYTSSDTYNLWVTADTVLHTAYDFSNNTIKIINARDIPFKVRLITNLSKTIKPNEIW